MILKNSFLPLYLFCLVLPGCTVGNTHTVGSYFSSVKNGLLNVQNEIELPVVKEKEILSENYDYSDPNKTNTPLYDTKGNEEVFIVPDFKVTNFNTLGADSFRYMRVDKGLLDCLANLSSNLGPFVIRAAYFPQNYHNNNFKHEKDSLSYHASGKAVDIIPPSSVALFARKTYELCGCNIGIGINDKWIHIELREEISEPWRESTNNNFLFKRVSKVHSAYCVNKKISKENSLFSKFKNKLGISSEGASAGEKSD
jgi:hypothetical protein